MGELGCTILSTQLGLVLGALLVADVGMRNECVWAALG